MGMYDYLNQPVINSTLCLEKDADSFFSPISLKHNGFAFDGYSYSNGVRSTSRATWASEAESDTRGPLPSFPTEALVIVNRASIAIMDSTTESLSMWMLFYLADNFAYGDALLSQTTAGFVAKSVTWANGRLSIVMSPDAGSPVHSSVVITFDFVADTVYADLSV